VNEIDPEAVIETDPEERNETVVAPVTTDETTMLPPVPLAESWRPPVRATGPERVIVAELALEERVSCLAVVLAERVTVVVAELPASWTCPEDESVPPTTIEGALGPMMPIGPPPLEESAPDTNTLCAPLRLMVMPKMLVSERVPVIVRSEVRVPRTCN